MSSETNVDDGVASRGSEKGTDAEESTDGTSDETRPSASGGVGDAAATRRAVLAATSGAVGAFGLASASASARAGTSTAKEASRADGVETPTEWLMDGFDLRNTRFPRNATAPTGAIEERWSFDVSVDHVNGGSYKTGRVEYAPPTIADGKVLVGDGSLRSDRNYLHAIDKDTGEHVWRRRMPEMNTAPAVGDGRVYAAGNASYVVGLDLETGRELWKWGTADVVRSSPKYHDGRVYVGCDDDTFYALNPEKGFSEWVFDVSDDATGLQMYGAPAIHDGVVYVGTWGPEGQPSYVYGLDAEDGDEVWKQSLGVSAGGAAPPTVGGEYLFVPNGVRGRMEAYELDGGRELAWSKQDFEFAPRNGPAFAGCRVFVGSAGGHVTGMDVETGEWAWRSDTRGAVEMPVMVANGTVYAVDDEGWLYGFAVRGGGKRFEYRIGEQASTTPRAVDGDLFLASNGVVQRLTGDSESFSIEPVCAEEEETTSSSTAQTAEPTETSTTAPTATAVEDESDGAETTASGSGGSPGFGLAAGASALAAAAGVALRRARREDDTE